MMPSPADGARRTNPPRAFRGAAGGVACGTLRLSAEMCG